MLVLALHAFVGCTVIAMGGRLGRRGLLAAAVAPAATLVWLAAHLSEVLAGEVVTERTTWVSGLDLSVDLRLDGFAALMVLVVAGMGLLVLGYAASYFEPDAPDLGRLAGLLALFGGAMTGVVLADNVLVLYTCWEVTSVTSYLLIGHDHAQAKARAAALHALLVTVAGGLAMLGGFVVLGQAAGSFRLSEILARHPTGGAVSLGLLLVLLGIFTKSAQYPFHGWLPGAMAAPTPVSAYLHSATMVKAGIYLLARLAPVFAVTGFWRPTVVVIGLLSMIAGGLRALLQNDLKLLLAFGTVSQLGFLAVLFGLGTSEAVEAGCVLLLAHAAFKAALFMVVGVIDRTAGTRDLRHLPVVTGAWWALNLTLVLSAASMAGLPLLAGFVAKESAYDGALSSGVGGRVALVAGLVAGSAITVAYSARLVWGVLVAPVRRGAPTATRAPSPWFVAPAAALALGSLVFGLAPAGLDRLVGSATRSLAADAGVTELALWHGFNLPLALSALTLTLGGALFWARRPVGSVISRGIGLPSGSDAYLAALRALNRTASRLTGLVQNGSLPIYTAVILLTAAILPVAAVVIAGAWPAWPDLVDAPAHLPVSALIVGSAIAAATNRRRVSAVLFLGLTGYAMAALFVIQGAPDLALTTVAIETLTTVLFVLVLRHLPVRFEAKASRQRRVLRLAAATTMGTAVFVLALMAGGHAPTDQVSDQMVERSLPDGHGRNVVNVILVDFRGFDTMGEIAVLAAAGIGAVALARAGRRPPAEEAP